MQYRPCRLVGVQPEGALQAEGRHLIFLGNELPRDNEPDCERRSAAIERRSCSR